MRKHWKIVALVVVVLAVGLVAAATVAAQGPRASDKPDAAPPMFGRMGGGMGGWQDYGEAVAKALGLTEDELRAKLRDGVTLADLAEEKEIDLKTLRAAYDKERTAALTERIDQALDDGKITKEYADWYKRGIEKDLLPGRMAADGNVVFAAIAKTLNMTAEDVELQMWAGRTLADLAQAADVAIEDVRAAIEAARLAEQRQQIEQAVQNGTLTRAQADWQLEGLERGFDMGRLELGFGPGMGLRGIGPKFDGAMGGPGGRAR